MRQEQKRRVLSQIQDCCEANTRLLRYSYYEQSLREIPSLALAYASPTKTAAAPMPVPMHILVTSI